MNHTMVNIMIHAMVDIMIYTMIDIIIHVLLDIIVHILFIKWNVFCFSAPSLNLVIKLPSVEVMPSVLHALKVD